MSPARRRSVARAIVATAFSVLLGACGGGGGNNGGGSTMIAPPPPPPPPAPVTGWRALASLPDGPRQEHGVALLNGEIYVIGGFDERNAIVTDVEVFNPQTSAWRRAAPLPQPLHHVNVGVARGRIYIVGALQGAGFIATGVTLEYDPTANTWTNRTAMPTGSERGASGVAVIADRIYVAGGLRGGSSVDSFSVYDPAANSWQTLQNMPTARDHLAAAEVNGVFYAIAGRNAGGLRSETEAYNPSTASWSVRRPMPTARGGIAGAAVANRIIVVGGEGNRANTAGLFDATESYDPATDTWAVLAPMRTPRHGMQAVGLAGVLYVPGGATREGFGAVDVFEAFTP